MNVPSHTITTFVIYNKKYNETCLKLNLLRVNFCVQNRVRVLNATFNHTIMTNDGPVFRMGRCLVYTDQVNKDFLHFYKLN